MKLHPEPSGEFANLAATGYQRYVLYRLEYSARRSTPGLAGVWLVLLVMVGLLGSRAGEIWPYLAVILFLACLSVGEIYFSRAVLNMLRVRESHKEEIVQPTF